MITPARAIFSAQEKARPEANALLFYSRFITMIKYKLDCESYLKRALTSPAPSAPRERSLKPDVRCSIPFGGDRSRTISIRWKPILIANAVTIILRNHVVNLSVVPFPWFLRHPLRLAFHLFLHSVARVPADTSVTPRPSDLLSIKRI